MKIIIVAVSNKTQFETFLSLRTQLHNEGYKYRYILIQTMTNPNYDAGLAEAVEQHESLFINIIRIKKLPAVAHLLQMIFFKRRLTYYFQQPETTLALTFSEGGAVDWIVIGLAKRWQTLSICMQWAITWPDALYEKLRQSPPHRTIGLSAIKNIVKILLGFNFKKMTCFGNGNADVVLTMGDFWTQFLSEKYPLLARQEKFITLGHPAWTRYKDISKRKDRKHLVFCTGAGPAIWNTSSEDHLNTIRAVYSACQPFLNTHQITLYHKPHPRDKHHDAIRELSADYSNIVITTSSLYDVFSRSYRMITIRSTTGFEALLAGLDVIIFDDDTHDIGFDYSKHHLAKKATNPQELVAILHESPVPISASLINECVCVEGIASRFNAITQKLRQNKHVAF